MPEVLKTWWRQVLGIVGGLALITGIIAFDARYAKSEDVKQTFTEVKKSFQLQQDLWKLESLNEQIVKSKAQIKLNPKDQEIKDEYNELKIKKEKLQQNIESGVK